MEEQDRVIEALRSAVAEAQRNVFPTEVVWQRIQSRATRWNRRRWTVRIAAVVAPLAATGGITAGAVGAYLPASHTQHLVVPAPSTTLPVRTTLPATNKVVIPVTSATNPAANPPADPPMCGTADLALSMGEILAGLGHDGLVLLFRNQSQESCVLRGYPGVAALASDGAQAAQAQRTPNAYLGGLPPGQTVPPKVVLAPGQSASARIESLDNPQNGATTCPRYPSLLVTAPNTTRGVQLSLG